MTRRGLSADPLLDPAAVERFLDAEGLGSGRLRARRIGSGHSNVTYLLERGSDRLVLRRPPLPPLPPSAHDMVREARLQIALARAGARVPTVLAVCEDESLLGVPFYVMAVVDGEVITESVPAALDEPAERRRVGEDLVEALVEIHAVDWLRAGLEGFGKPTGYLERQVRRFSGLWEVNATRDLPAVGEIAGWLERHRPESPVATVVHGDYRLGNVMVAPEPPGRVLAVLDWELATIGDPLADVGYMLATYGDESSGATPLELAPVTRLQGFPTRAELARRYEERSGRSIGNLSWYQTLALWKSAVFCEAIYGRYLRGETSDAWAGALATGVPSLLEAARLAAAT